MKEISAFLCVCVCVSACADKRPHEDTVRGWPSTSQEESSHEETKFASTLIMDG